MEGQIRPALERLIADFRAEELPEPTGRRVRLPSLPGKADAVVGMRRSGKTWFLFQRIHELLRDGVPAERILYVNFEDERLVPLAASELHEILDALYRRHPEVQSSETWLFFDEIQVVSGWELFVRRLIDERKHRIVVTGSSATLMSREIATSLRGRSLGTELLPFSFAEFLDHAGVDIPRAWPPPARRRSQLARELRRYLAVGGFPEVQGVSQDLRVRILQDYLDVVLFRDIVERHAVTNVDALRYLVRRLLRSPAGRFSVTRFANDLKSQGVKVGKDTLYQYLSHLEDAFLVFLVPVYGDSEKRRRVNPRKVYPIDPALAQALSYSVGKDVGHLLENIVYLEARRRGLEAAYVMTSSGFEVDFMLTDRQGGRRLVQVCADPTDPSTRARELRALHEALRETGLTEATIVTLDDDFTEDVDSGSIRAIPAWRWLLEGTPA